MKKSSIICVTIGIILVILGLTALFSLPLVIIKLINSKLYFSPSNPSFSLWRDLPVPIESRYYLFNVTNWRDVQDNGAKPRLEQIGPFVYRMSIRKNDLNVSENGEHIHFVETMSYFFDRNQSIADDTTVVTTLNAPLAIAFGLLDGVPFALKVAALAIIKALNEPFFIERSVRELLFDGYSDTLTKIAPLLNPDIPLQTKFGWMYQKNATGDGVFGVNTGKSDLKKINAIETWNGLTKMKFWSGDYCNSFSGATNGEMYYPLDMNQNSIQFFRTNICRTWKMVFHSLAESFGVSVYRFYPDNNTFANSTDYPPNSCFTPHKKLNAVNDMKPEVFESKIAELFKQINKTEELEILMSQLKNETYYNDFSNLVQTENQHNLKSGTFASGVFPLTGCQYRAPVYLSYAHFFDADKTYLDSVIGLKPNASIHQTYLDVEPVTGTSTAIAVRLQINVYVNPVFPLYRKMPTLVFPVLWEELTIHVTDDIAKQLNWTVKVPSMIATIVSAVFVAIGVILLLCLASTPLWKHCKTARVSKIIATTSTSNDDNEEQHLINEDDKQEDKGEDKQDIVIKTDLE